MRLSIFISLLYTHRALAAPAKSSQKEGLSAYDILISASSHVDNILARINRHAGQQDIYATFSNTGFKGFSGSLSAAEVKHLKTLPGVLMVEPQIEMTEQADTEMTTGSPWGLQRISQHGSMTAFTSITGRTFNYSYSDPRLGAGVDIYVVDGGINIDHLAFGGRASNGFTAFPSFTDINGHGTHCAGTAAGYPYGVAPNANILSVKVLSNGSGSSSTGIMGLDWIVQNHQNRSTQPDFVGSVASFSWTLAERSPALEVAVNSMTALGIHAAVAAGNLNDDACNYSPASLGAANGPVVTVGYTDVYDTIGRLSDTGPCVGMYAPGASVPSAWIGSTTATRVQSGTSMACPLVSGLMAYLMVGRPELRNDTAAMKAYLTSLAVSDAVKPKTSGVMVNGGGPLLLANNRYWDTSVTPRR